MVTTATAMMAMKMYLTMRLSFCRKRIMDGLRPFMTQSLSIDEPCIWTRLQRLRKKDWCPIQARFLRLGGFVRGMRRVWASYHGTASAGPPSNGPATRVRENLMLA